MSAGHVIFPKERGRHQAEKKEQISRGSCLETTNLGRDSSFGSSVISLGLYSAFERARGSGDELKHGSLQLPRGETLRWKRNRRDSPSVTADSALEIKVREEVERNSCQRA